MSGQFWTGPFGIKTYMGTLGHESSLSWESTFPGGDSFATVTLDVDPALPHVAFSPGIRCGISVGAIDIWTGVLNAPSTSDRRVLTATGDGALPRWYVSDAANAYDLATAWDAARTRGLPLTRSTLPTLTGATARQASVMLGDALDYVANALGQFWLVRDQNLVFVTTNSGDAYSLVVTTDPAGRTLDGYASRVYAGYINIATALYASLNRVVTSDPIIINKEGILDLTGSAAQLTTAQATAQADNALVRIGRRSNYTGEMPFVQGQILNAGGTPVDLATVRAGFTGTVVSPLTNALGDPNTGPQTFVAGRVVYDQDSGVLTVQPLDVQARSTSDVLAQISL